jgi:hypothetical protein
MHQTKRRHDFGTYLAAHRRAYAWAERALLYRSAGKFARARAAVERVNHWMHHIAMLAPQPQYGAAAARGKKLR